jgi:HK97 family phage major capsid protein
VTPRVIPQPRPVESDEVRAFLAYLRAPLTRDYDARPEELITHEEYRVLSKGASGGGFFVPAEISPLIVAAARTTGVLSQLAQPFETGTGDSLGVPLAGSPGIARRSGERESNLHLRLGEPPP